MFLGKVVWEAGCTVQSIFPSVHQTTRRAEPLCEIPLPVFFWKPRATDCMRASQYTLGPVQLFTYSVCVGEVSSSRLAVTSVVAYKAAATDQSIGGIDVSARRFRAAVVVAAESPGPRTATKPFSLNFFPVSWSISVHSPWTTSGSPRAQAMQNCA